MLTLACHICFRPRFMSDHPELYYWVYMLPVALLAFWFIRHREEKLAPSDVVTHTIGAGVCYFVLWKMGLFRLLIYPLVLLTFGFLLRALVRAENQSRMIAGMTLGLFLFTGLYAYHLRSSRGAFWELQKQQSPTASFGWLANAAKEKRFTRDQLLKYMKSENAQVRKNARHIAVLQGQEESSFEEVEPFYRALEEVDPELAKSYFLKLTPDLQFELRESLEPSRHRY